MNAETGILEGRVVRLEPLAPCHAEGLWLSASDEAFRYMALAPLLVGWGPAAFAEFVTRSCAEPNRLPFAVVLQASGEVVGQTAIHSIDRVHRGLEIGSTWIAAGERGTAVNPECKYLLLRHAFETMAMLRMQFKTDLRNTRSQRALEKLGATREGVLRRHRLLPDGHLRDSVCYSVTNDEWPAVRSRIEARLASL